MPKQKGIIPIQGTMGDLTFYKTKDGYGVRGKGGVEADRILNAPEFERTRENIREFTRAGKACKALRTALCAIIKRVSDDMMTSRMSKLFNRVVRTDTMNNRGERTVQDGQLEFFRGFEFNAENPMSSTVYAKMAGDIDRKTGAAMVAVSAMVPVKFISMPPGATHYLFTAVAAEVDFATGDSVSTVATSDELPLTEATAPPLNLHLQLPVNSSKPLFLALCIEFLQEVNGRFYGLNSGKHNAMAMLAVDQVVI